LIKEINEDIRQFASHTQIVDSLLKDSEPKTMLETARMLTRFSETQQIASNMVAWWSQQITVGFNPFNLVKVGTALRLCSQFFMPAMLR